MGKEKYRINYWNKLLLFLSIIGGCILTFLFYMNKDKEEAMIDFLSEKSTTEFYLSVNAKYQDSIFPIVIYSPVLYQILYEDKSVSQLKEFSYEKLLNVLSKDTLSIDSTSFLKLRNSIVVSQTRIDSIYNKGGVEELISFFFKKINKTTSILDSGKQLTPAEELYLIDVLTRNKRTLAIDCETGAIKMSILP